MLSRLKGIETFLPGSQWLRGELPLDMLSRLKGIETGFTVLGVAGVPKLFGYAFPFEGNWNTPDILSAFPLTSLDMLSRLKGIETEYTEDGLAQMIPPLDMLSRLKGIET